MKQAALFLLAMLGSVTSWASFTQQPETSGVVDTLDGNMSFNVVIAVVLIILAGVLAFLFRLDRKISKLEKEIKK